MKLLFAGTSSQVRNTIINIVSIVFLLLYIHINKSYAAPVIKGIPVYPASSFEVYRNNPSYNIKKPQLHFKVKTGYCLENSKNDYTCNNNTLLQVESSAKKYPLTKAALKQIITRATLRAEKIVKQTRKAFALEDEAMMPQHPFVLRQQTVSCGIGDEKALMAGIYPLRKCIGAFVLTGWYDASSLAFLLFVFSVAVAYCYERFYYRQREAYPQRGGYAPFIQRANLFNGYTHSGVLSSFSPLYLFSVIRKHPAHEGLRCITTCSFDTKRVAVLPVTIAQIQNHYTVNMLKREAL